MIRMMRAVRFGGSWWLIGIALVGCAAAGCINSPVSGASCEEGEYADDEEFTCQNGYTVPTGSPDGGEMTDASDVGADIEDDAGPACAPNCQIGESCVSGSHCLSGVCAENADERKVCQAPTCEDGVQNGGESDTDCGGPDCEPCGDGDACEQPSDCMSGVCDDGTCIAAACRDGVQNGQETAVDCGGPNCPPCEMGEACDANSDCVSGVCQADGSNEKTCQAPTCMDGVENGTESDVDCGGECDACSMGRDCDGPGDCASGVCDDSSCVAPTCMDGVQNGEERDVDCGGGCGPCGVGQSCTTNSHCVSGVCDEGSCQMPTCQDGVLNGDETDSDCGGPACGPCEAGATCDARTDCISGVCAQDGTCSEPTCMDGVQNGSESDTDCGGSCDGCLIGDACNVDSDCAGQNCDGGTCAASCMDNMQNQGESDVDCGGPCSGCAPGKSCNGPSDCSADNVCNANSVCQVELHQTTQTYNGQSVTAVQWTDGTYAEACDAYRNPTASHYVYAGATGDGTFWIKPGSSAPVVPLECRFVNPSGGGAEGWTRVYYNEFTASANSANAWAPDDDTRQCSLPNASTPNYVLGGDGNYGGSENQPFTPSATLDFEADVPHSEVDFDAVFVRNDEWELPGEDNADSIEIDVASTTVYGPAVTSPTSPSQSVCGDTGYVTELDSQTSPVSRGANPPANVSVEVESDNTASNEWWAFDNVAVWVH